MRNVLIFLGILVLSMNIFGVVPCDATPYQAGSFDPVRPNQDDWTCYDYSIDYARNNTEWGVITVSNNPNFVGESHMLNYRVNGSSLEFYDPYWTVLENRTVKYSVEIDDMRMRNPCFKPAYYHVWDETRTPWRNYVNNVENIQEVI